MGLARALVLLCLVVVGPVAAQTWDTSGNGMLKGTYYFRQVLWVLSSGPASDLDEAVALYGTLTFDGNGSYSINAQSRDCPFPSSNNCVNRTVSFTDGAYSVAASGQGFLSNPLVDQDNIHGVVSRQGIFIGSSTEGSYNDLFIAAPVSSPAPTNATFRGAYTVAAMDLSSGNSTTYTSSLFQLNPDGAGNLGTVAGTGYTGNSGSTSMSQSTPGIAYMFVNGVAVTTFPNQSAVTPFLYGQKNLYISTDGGFIFGGSPVGFDFFVGVRADSNTPPFGGLYVQAGIDADVSQAGGTNGYVVLDTYYGSLNAVAAASAPGCPDQGCEIGHQRIQDLFASSAYDYTYSQSYGAVSSGTYATSFARYAVGAGGVRIGSGIGPYLGLNVALPAQAPTATGVFLLPAGVTNAASSAPFTAGVAPGEILVLYGSRLAPSSTPVRAASLPLPLTLSTGVQVMINGAAAPLLYVSDTQVSALMPYGITTAAARIQVVNNGTASNTATVWVNITSPGVFTQNQDGLGNAAALHADYSLVTPANPAKIGETILLYVTGLGAVDPAVSDGAAAPSNPPLSNTTNSIFVNVGGQQAKISYSGLAPGFAGLYQLNVEIPAGITDGGLAIDGPDGFNVAAELPLAPAAQSSARALAATSAPRLARSSRTAAPASRRQSNPRRQSAR